MEQENVMNATETSMDVYWNMENAQTELQLYQNEPL